MNTKTKDRPNKGFYVSGNRKSKAKKIVAILEEEKGGDLKDCIILDIGTGNGEIANYLASIAKQVISIDITLNPTVKGSYDYLISNENLPFKSASIDIVISNHVIEHVENNTLHIKEISRVLKQAGIVYLATPNRLWPWEVHYKLLLLHYLPNKIFIKLLKTFKLYHEDLNLLSWKQLRRLTINNFSLSIYCDKVTKEPDKYYMNVNKNILKLLKLVPLSIYTFFTVINPTLIVTLRKIK